MSILDMRRRLMVADRGPKEPIALFANGAAGVDFSPTTTTTSPSVGIYENNEALTLIHSSNTANITDDAMYMKTITGASYQRAAAFISEGIDVTGYNTLTFKGTFKKSVAAVGQYNMVSYGVAVSELYPDSSQVRIYTAGYAGSFQNLQGAGVIVRGYGLASTTEEIPFEHEIDLSGLTGIYYVVPFVLIKKYACTAELRVTEMIMS